MTRFSSEDDFLSLIDRHFPRRAPGVLTPRGDDAAVVDWPTPACVTTDLFVENVHFRRRYFTPPEIGRKALAVNVSDIAAMGARPAGFTLGLTAPPDTDREFWDGLLSGMAALADDLSLPLVGGDLNLGPAVMLAVTVWGAAGPSGRFLGRAAARPGHILFCVGEIGLAAAGLDRLEVLGRGALAEWPRATAAHLSPAVRLEAAARLAGIPAVAGLMDVSDGLYRDLPRFLGPGLGADLDLAPDRLDPEVLALARLQGRDPVKAALAGGEDYALLGAVAPDDLAGLTEAVPEAYVIGRVVREPGLTRPGRAGTGRGFDHFGGVA